MNSLAGVVFSGCARAPIRITKPVASKIDVLLIISVVRFILIWLPSNKPHRDTDCFSKLGERSPLFVGLNSDRGTIPGSLHNRSLKTRVDSPRNTNPLAINAKLAEDIEANF